MVNNNWWSVVLVCAIALGAQEAWAKRLGGGLSFGKQSGQVAQRSNSAPAQQATPAAPTQSAATRPAPANAAAAAAPQRPWGGMLGGLAAGLGLAWLASSLGFGEGFAQFLMFALLAAVVMVAVGFVLRRRAGAGTAAGLAYQTDAGGGNAGGGQSQFDPATPRGYSPKNVGNDASARPWESTYDEPMMDDALGASPLWGVPADFDEEGFLKASKANFRSLQDAWDRSDVASLRAMMTDSMLEQIQGQLVERERTGSGSSSKTDVVMLEARLLGIEAMDDAYMASVEFSGLIREDASAGPNPFREVWNITRAKRGTGGWLVAGVQALQ